jgi:carnitine O-acetyltransferase
METTMANSEKTSSRVGKVASKALRDPSSATNREIKTLAASALTQRPDKPKGSGKKK